jgi:hypothetical protein
MLEDMGGLDKSLLATGICNGKPVHIYIPCANECVLVSSSTLHRLVNASKKPRGDTFGYMVNQIVNDVLNI